MTISDRSEEELRRHGLDSEPFPMFDRAVPSDRKEAEAAIREPLERWRGITRDWATFSPHAFNAEKGLVALDSLLAVVERYERERDEARADSNQAWEALGASQAVVDAAEQVKRACFPSDATAWTVQERKLADALAALAGTETVTEISGKDAG